MGESLDETLIRWGEDTLNLTIQDTYGQAETGSMVLNNYPPLEARSGSMGKPLPGVSVEILNSKTGEPLGSGEVGQIALEPDFPCFFSGYWKKPKQLANRFINGWYLTGDRGYVDDDGYFWFERRSNNLDDSSSRYPEQEAWGADLAAHPDVAETNVRPSPDSGYGEITNIYITLAEDSVPSKDLRYKLFRQLESNNGGERNKINIEFAPSGTNEFF